MTRSTALTLARDALTFALQGGVYAPSCRIALAAIEAELAASEREVASAHADFERWWGKYSEAADPRAHPADHCASAFIAGQVDESRNLHTNRVDESAVLHKDAAIDPATHRWPRLRRWLQLAAFGAGAGIASQIIVSSLRGYFS